MVNKDMNVLIVDDYQTMLRIMRNLLGQIGFRNVNEATDGQMAFDMLQTKEYGLIISDWNMEPVSGIEFLKQVRASEGPHKDVPFIMVTAESKTDNVIQAKQAGVSNYIVKPFNAQTLKQKMSTVLGEFD